jgi:DNA-binding NtrC family response regulator
MLFGRHSAAAGVFSDRRILVVEDDFLIAVDLEDMLSRLGFMVISTRDAASSLEHIRMHRFDAAVLDSRLGGVPTSGLADALAAAAVPFAIMSGLETTARHRGVPLLRKPFSFEQLAYCMTEVLGARLHVREADTSRQSLKAVRHAELEDAQCGIGEMQVP